MNSSQRRLADRPGNVVARYGSDKSDALRLMIFAHMDEVGLYGGTQDRTLRFLRSFERVGGPAQITKCSGSDCDACRTFTGRYHGLYRY
ncbi:hypothetical protein KCP70_24615 [Salmonella enterica subsp. enterica]|nr:hypothetical protein KCP70_24615 [Salmonella enterica subsp. enterica]